MTSRPEGSRRRFLQSVAAGAGAGLVWPAAAQAAGEGAAESAVPHRHDVGLSRDEIVAAVSRSVAMVASGVDDIFPQPFESGLLASDERLRAHIIDLVVGSFASAERDTDAAGVHAMIIPKGASGLRRVAHIEAIEAIRYLACAILAGPYTERARVPVSESQVFSYRFLAAGARMFDAACTYEAFQEAVLGRLDEEKRLFLVRADIADFYPSIGADGLSQALLDCDVPTGVAETVAATLTRWNGPAGRGLPVGSDASRMLAEAVLRGIDVKLTRDGIGFVRFCDDFCLFAPDAAAARHGLAQLTEHLAVAGFALNQDKTSIASVNRGEYEDILAARRGRRLWGRAYDQLAQNTPEPKPEKKKKKPPKRKVPKPDTTRYRDSPFESVILNEDDVALLDQVDRARLGAELAGRAAAGRNVSLGEFRLLIEASRHHGDHAQLGAAFEIVAQCPHGVSYLVNVLINEQDALSPAMRAAAPRWAANRLASAAQANDHEVLQLARLLATPGYRDADAIRDYLVTAGHTASPIAARNLVAALNGQCDAAMASALLAVCGRTGAFVRRAIVALIWPHLTGAQRAALMRDHAQEFARDPFLQAAMGEAGV